MSKSIVANTPVAIRALNLSAAAEAVLLEAIERKLTVKERDLQRRTKRQDKRRQCY